MLKTLLLLILYVTVATSHNQYERYYRNEASKLCYKNTVKIDDDLRQNIKHILEFPIF